jgi:hypothetical protein
MTIRLTVYICVSCLLAGIQLSIWARIAAQVNERNDRSKRYSLSLWSVRDSAWEGNDSSLWRAHRHFFPNSRLRRWYVVGTLMTVGWLIFGLRLLTRS